VGGVGDDGNTAGEGAAGGGRHAGRRRLAGLIAQRSPAIAPPSAAAQPLVAFSADGLPAGGRRRPRRPRAVRRLRRRGRPARSALAAPRLAPPAVRRLGRADRVRRLDLPADAAREPPAPARRRGRLRGRVRRDLPAGGALPRGAEPARAVGAGRPGAGDQRRGLRLGAGAPAAPLGVPSALTQSPKGPMSIHRRSGAGR
jgi:hypothetical protein